MRAAVAALLLVGGCGGGPTVCAQLGAERGCVADRNAAYRCDHDVYQEMPCGPRSACVDGECRAKVCEAIDFRCDRDVAETCVDNGTRLKREDCALSGAACVVEALTARCVTHSCTPRQTYCAPDGTEVRKCSEDGRRFDVVERCDGGERCVGARCLDRCTLVEAQERTTRGCRFTMMPPGSNAFQILVGNGAPDRAAEVTIGDGVSTRAVVVQPGETASISWSARLPAGTGAGAYAISVDANLPVEVWARAVGGAAGMIVPPLHALGSEHRVSSGLPGEQRLLVAAPAATTVSIESPVAFEAGGGVPALAAGQTMTRALAAGEVLALARYGMMSGVA
jgi:hypothetical protein